MIHGRLMHQSVAERSHKNHEPPARAGLVAEKVAAGIEHDADLKEAVFIGFRPGEIRSWDDTRITSVMDGLYILTRSQPTPPSNGQ